MDNSAALRSLTSGLYIVSSNGGGDHACVINTATQVTNAPETIMIAVNRNNKTCASIEAAGKFSLSILDESATMELIGRFGFKSGLGKFENYDGYVVTDGIKTVTESSCATLTATVVSATDVGAHRVFIAAVTSSTALKDTVPLTYRDYHLKKKGLTPKNAPNYSARQNDESAQKSGAKTERTTKKYRCKICGYIYEGEMPDDYVCPICGAGKDAFELIES